MPCDKWHLFTLMKKKKFLSRLQRHRRAQSGTRTEECLSQVLSPCRKSWIGGKEKN
jgi:hypothetical protein